MCPLATRAQLKPGLDRVKGSSFPENNSLLDDQSSSGAGAQAFGPFTSVQSNYLNQVVYFDVDVVKSQVPKAVRESKAFDVVIISKQLPGLEDPKHQAYFKLIWPTA